MNPQDSHTASLSVLQPLAALDVAGSETTPQGKRLDEVTHGSQSEHPRSSSTENSSDRSRQSPGLEGTSENLLQLSTYLVPGVPSTVARFLDHGVVAPSEFKRLENGNGGLKTEGEGEVEDDRKKEREHKKRSKNWTRLETLTLIRARSNLDEKFRKTGRKVALWDEIAQALQGANFSRDAQQCKDKWEKLTAGYKEVRDGAREREDHPFYDQLHQLLSWKTHRREGAVLADPGDAKSVKVEFSIGHVPSEKEAEAPYCAANGSTTPVELRDGQREETSSPRKRKRVVENTSLTDLAVVQDLLETVITRQQRFFKDLLEAMERKEQLREQIRHEREEKWRAEERAQRIAFSNAMVVLTQRLLGERPGAVTAPMRAPLVVAQPEGLGGPKKRSKNWKRTEVLQLIRFRREMDARFSKSTRRAGLWDELGERLVSLGIRRDGKQCREKWDKLMAEYKDVTDGRKEQDESPYFAELSAFLRRTVEEVEGHASQETHTKEEYAEL